MSGKAKGNENEISKKILLSNSDKIDSIHFSIREAPKKRNALSSDKHILSGMNVILQNEKVESSCAVGVSDKQHSQGKLPYVYVVCKNKDVDEDKLNQELYELCKAELPEYAMPIGFSICDSLPVTNIGKIDYRKLEDMANEE